MIIIIILIEITFSDGFQKGTHKVKSKKIHAINDKSRC